MKEALWLANWVTVITKRQGQRKGRVPMPLFQRFFILQVIIWFPKNRLLLHKRKITFSRQTDNGVLDSVTAYLMLLRHIRDIYETWGPMSLNHVTPFHPLFCWCWLTYKVQISWKKCIYRTHSEPFERLVCFRVVLCQKASKFTYCNKFH